MKRSNTQIKFKRRWQVVRHSWSTQTNRAARRNAAAFCGYVNSATFKAHYGLSL